MKTKRTNNEWASSVLDWSELAFSSAGLSRIPFDTLLENLSGKDKHTAEHCIRVGMMSYDLAGVLGFEGRARESIGLSGILHDVGKLETHINILRKPGKLTADEFVQIKKHPENGAEIVSNYVGQMNSFEKQIVDGIRYHHERYDGKGYPEGLMEEEIPIAGRIIAVADAYDAMSFDRSYRKRMSFEDVCREIVESSGTQFDPRVVKAFGELAHVYGTFGGEHSSGVAA